MRTNNTKKRKKNKSSTTKKPSGRRHEILVERELVARLFGSKCAVCLKNYGKKFLFHHTRYKDGEMIYSDFSNTTEYHEYLLPLIRLNPQRFRLLCVKCHYAVEALKKYKTDKLDRLIRVVKDSI